MYLTLSPHRQNKRNHNATKCAWQLVGYDTWVRLRKLDGSLGIPLAEKYIIDVEGMSASYIVDSERDFELSGQLGDCYFGPCTVEFMGSLKLLYYPNRNKRLITLGRGTSGVWYNKP